MADDAKIQSWLLSTNTETKPVPVSDVLPNVPGGGNSVINKPVGLAPRTFEERNYNGLPIKADVEPSLMRLIGEAVRTDADQKISYWQQLYGDQNVRVADDGTILVKTVDNDGKEVEIPTNSKSFYFKDLVKNLPVMFAQMAAAGGAVKGARNIPGGVGKKMGPLGFARDLVAGAAGAEAAGALQDVATRLTDEGSNFSAKDLAHIANERARMAIGDVFVGGAMGLLGTVASRLYNPSVMADRPPIQVDLEAAKKHFMEKGIDPGPSTIGEATGLPFAQRWESQAAKQPGGAGTMFAQMAQKQVQAFQRIYNTLVGLPQEATQAERQAFLNDDLGYDAVDLLRSGVEPLHQAVISAQESAVSKFSADLLKSLSRAVPAARQMYDTQIGKAIRTRVQTAYDQFRGARDALYNAVYELPGGKDRIIATPGMAKAAKEMLDSLPPKTVVSTEVSPVVDASGSAIKRTIEDKLVADEFVASGIINKLKALIENPAEQRSLNDLVNMRAKISEEINWNEAMGGQKSRDLYRLRDILNRGIDEATESLPDGALKKAFTEANRFNRLGMQRFDHPAIKRILQDAEQGGFEPAALAEKAGSNIDFYNGLKNFLGANSPEFLAVKRRVLDRLYDGATINGTSLIDGKVFAKRLQDAYESSPEIFTDILGPKSGDRMANLFLSADALSMAQKARVDVNAVDKILAGKAKFQPLGELAFAQRELDKVYRNSILKMIGSKTLPADGIHPAEFVDRFLSTANHEEARQVMDILAQDPQLYQRVKAQTVMSVLAEATRTPAPSDRVAFRLDPQGALSVQRLQQIMSGPRARVLEEVIGQDGVEGLKNLAKLIKPTESRQLSFSAAGGMQAGAIISGLEKGGIMRFIDSALHNTLFAAIETSQPVRNYFTKQPLSADARHALMTVVMTSEPMMRMLVDNYGLMGSQFAAQQIKNGMDSYMDNAYKPSIDDARKTAQIRSFLLDKGSNAPAGPVQPIQR